jgi:hypothetical protein
LLLANREILGNDLAQQSYTLDPASCHLENIALWHWAGFCGKTPGRFSIRSGSKSGTVPNSAVRFRALQRLVEGQSIFTSIVRAALLLEHLNRMSKPHSHAVLVFARTIFRSPRTEREQVISGSRGTEVSNGSLSRESMLFEPFSS